MAKLKSVKGILSKNFPPIVNIIAKNIEPIKINFLKFLDIFFDEVLVINLSKK